MINPPIWLARVLAVAVALGALLALGPWLGAEARGMLQTAPSLGAAASFGVLAHTTVTNVPASPSIVTGDLGVSNPPGATTGFIFDTPPGAGTVTGSVHRANATTTTAQTNLTAAVNVLEDPAANPCTQTDPSLVNATLAPGVYCFTVDPNMSGTLTLASGVNAAAVFVFRMPAALTAAVGTTVIYTGAGLPCNVFWRVGSQATLGTNTTFVGNIIAGTSIVLGTGANVAGRALAQTAAVTMDNNRVGQGCAVGLPTATAVPTATTAPTATATPVPATATAIAAATATAIATLPPPTQTAVIAATHTAITAATATAIATLPPATRTAVIAATNTAVIATATAVAAATAAAAGPAPAPGCVANIRGSKVDGAGAGVPDWTVQLLQGEQVVRSTTTDKNGNWDFLGLPLGNYAVREVSREGWVVQGADRYDVQLTACGQNAAGHTFVNLRGAGPVAPTQATAVAPTSTAVALATGAATATAASTPSAAPSALPRTGGGPPVAELLALVVGGLLLASGVQARRSRP